MPTIVSEPALVNPTVSVFHDPSTISNHLSGLDLAEEYGISILFNSEAHLLLELVEVYLIRDGLLDLYAIDAQRFVAGEKHSQFV